MSKDSGATYTTVFSGSQSINIASVSAGAVAGSLVSGVSLDAGSYTTVRVTIGDTLSAKGFVNDGGNNYYTDGGADYPAASSSIAGSTPGSDYAISTYAIPAANRTSTTTLTTPMQVRPDLSPTATEKFDTSGVFTVSGGALVPGAPTVTVTSR
jgi:hypothetical protein